MLVLTLDVGGAEGCTKSRTNLGKPSRCLEKQGPSVPQMNSCITRCRSNGNGGFDETRERRQSGVGISQDRRRAEE